MSIDRENGDKNPSPVPTGIDAGIVVIAAAFAAVAGWLTNNWETGTTVFVAVVSLFAAKRDGP